MMKKEDAACWWSRMKSSKIQRIPLFVTAVCLCGIIFSLVTAIDLALFVHALQTSKLANPPKTDSLIFLLLILCLLAIVLSIAAWRIQQRQALQRMIATQWSFWIVLLWTFILSFTLLVNYPVPAQAHHTDKFFIASLIVLLWSAGFTFWPIGLMNTLRSKLFLWLKIVLVNIVFFVVVGEIVFRLADPMLAKGGLFGDKHTPAYLKPHTPVRGSIGLSNSQGFRDRARSIERTTSVPRIVALGDSFTWGAGVSYDEAFVTLLERTLEAEYPGIELINLGVPAWGPNEELHLLKTYGIQFLPDLVMLNFFIGNDIQNKRGDDTRLPDILVVAGQSYYVHSNGNWVHDVLGPSRWYLYHNLNYLIQMGTAMVSKVAEEWRGDQQEIGAASDWAPLVSRRQYVRRIHERSDIYRKEHTPFFTIHWERTQSTLLEMRDLLRAHGIPLLLILLPDHVQIDRELQREYLDTFGQHAEAYDFLQPQRLLREWCRENGIETMDLLDDFASEDNPRSLYFVNDFHFTAKGHALTNAKLLPILQAQLARLRRLRAGYHQ
jgi:lysophospholipase L1-like esterase